MKQSGRIAALLLACLLASGSCSRGPGGISVQPGENAPAPVSSPAEPEQAAVSTDGGRIVVKGEENQPSIIPSEAPGIYTPETRPSHVKLTTDSPYRIVYTTSTCNIPEASRMRSGFRIMTAGTA